VQVRQRAASEAAPHLSGPIRVQETPGSQTVKRALEFRSWQAASDLVRGWEADVQIGGGNQSSRRSHRRSITSSPTCRPRTSVPNRSASTTTCSSRGCAPGVRRGDSATCRSSASSRPASSAARGAAALATRSRTCDATDSSGHSRWHHRSQWIAKDVRSSPQAAHRGASHSHAVRPIASVSGFRLRFHTTANSLSVECRWGWPRKRASRYSSASRQPFLPTREAVHRLAELCPHPCLPRTNTVTDGCTPRTDATGGCSDRLSPFTCPGSARRV